MAGPEGRSAHSTRYRSVSVVRYKKETAANIDMTISVEGTTMVVNR
jgi:hypothetical protein